MSKKLRTFFDRIQEGDTVWFVIAACHVPKFLQARIIGIKNTRPLNGIYPVVFSGQVQKKGYCTDSAFSLEKVRVKRPDNGRTETIRLPLCDMFRVAKNEVTAKRRARKWLVADLATYKRQLAIVEALLGDEDRYGED